MRRLLSVCAVLGLLFSNQAGAEPLAVKDVPEPLKPWVGWVLKGHEERQCPFLYNSSETHHCRWPYPLRLVLQETRGSFEQQWSVVEEGWVPLPGGVDRWPQNVKVGEGAALVAQRQGVPSIYVPAGRHRVSGEFAWSRLPESLQIPKETGLVSVSVNGRKLAFPDIDREGKLWLKERGGVQESEGGVKNALDVKVYRRIIDEIPLRVVTLVEMDAAGEYREVLLGPALMAGTIPVALTSPLPARLEQDGRLRVQIRPGHWAVELVSRYPGPVDSVTLEANEAPWPGEEVWVFESRNHLRLVRIVGGTAIDPRQTSLPGNWKNLPAYRLQPGEALRMEVERRGDPDPEPDRLSLVRSLWLDSDGGGYTVQDQVQGTMTHNWRLEVAPVMKLGQVVVDGEPQFITRLKGTEHEGVELRRGEIHLVADSRFEGRVSRIPAVGWTSDFRQVRATLQLPPGWRLLTTTGIDEVRSTWVNRWSVFDLFILLIIAAAVGKLWGWHWGGLALATLALIYHEAGAPRQIWLHILAAVALLRVLPDGRFKRLVGLYRNLSFVVLAVIAFPFAVNQVRVGLFPQLERPWQVVGQMDRTRAANARLYKKDDQVRRESGLSGGRMQAEAPMASSELKSVPGSPFQSGAGYGPSRTFDPDAVVQTGPGLPRWVWHSVQFVWNGPIEPSQEVRLVLLSPGFNLVLRLLSVLLMAILIARMLNLTYQGGSVRFFNAGTAALLILVQGIVVPGVAQAEFPSDKILGELRERLLERPSCLPQCAESPRMQLQVDGKTLRSRMEVHTFADIAVPLPGRPGQWQAQTVLLGGESVTAVFRDSTGRQWLRLSRGHHQVLLEGPLPGLDRVQIDLPLKPRRVQVQAEGWVIEGIHEDGIADDQLQLSREKGSPSQPDPKALEPGALPPFVRVERTLRLGLEWQVETQVIRDSPMGSAVVLEVPVLSGESVTSDGVRVEHGKVLVNMAPRQSRTMWQSVLEKREKIDLTAPQTSGWTEVWRLDSSPIWHVDSGGIPVVHHQNQGRWLPEWRPWPGESVSLEVTRPQGVKGKTLTVDASGLTLRPGRRGTDSELTVALRSSQGGQHNLTLPEGALLQSVRINNQLQPIRQQGRTVNLPLTPGEQELTLSWHQPSGIGERFVSPPVGLGIESVNSSAKVMVPRNRWVLFAGGPRLGPAVTFWGLFIVIGLVAFPLGRIKSMPLGATQWVLLGLGLTQIPVWLAVVVVGWLFALDARRRIGVEMGRRGFNLMQIGLAMLTLAALAVLYFAVKQGLLGWPNMYIAGNGSSSYLLQWFQDRAGNELPRVWVLSVPTAVYRVLMLAWALWLAFALLRWLRWGWECYSEGGLWFSGAFARRRPETGGTGPEKAGT